MNHVYFAVLSRYFIQGVIVNVMSNSKRVDCHVLGLQRKKKEIMRNSIIMMMMMIIITMIIILLIIIVIIIIIIVKDIIALLSLHRFIVAACSASLHLDGIYGHAVVTRL